MALPKVRNYRLERRESNPLDLRGDAGGMFVTPSEYVGHCMAEWLWDPLIYIL